MAARLSLFLGVDLGNSGAKLSSFRIESAQGSDIVRIGDATRLRPLEEYDPRAARRDARALGCEQVALSSVLDEDTTRAWAAALADAFGAPVNTALDSGLENRTLAPERVGRDRLFAARGALECLGENAVVIDVGTAAKVDLLSVERDGARLRGAFLGGAIAPGPTLLARALAQGTARLFEIDPRPDPPALGRDSRSAMESGVAVGLRGAVRELERELAREVGWVDPPIALCGGARAFVQSAFRGRRLLDEPQLVGIGLCAALLDLRDGARPRRWVRE